MVELARVRLALERPQPPFECIFDCAYDKRAGYAGLNVIIGRETVFRGSIEAFLIQYVAGIDTSIDEVNGYSGVVWITPTRHR